MFLSDYISLYQQTWETSSLLSFSSQSTLCRQALLFQEGAQISGVRTCLLAEVVFHSPEVLVSHGGSCVGPCGCPQTPPGQGPRCCSGPAGRDLSPISGRVTCFLNQCSLLWKGFLLPFLCSFLAVNPGCQFQVANVITQCTIT